MGFLRLWRLSRLHETLVAAERTRTEEKAQEARTERERALRAEVERARLEGVAAESANARQRLEKMARAFKDEIDTLNEALVIAARDIAEAADSEIESENEREGGEVQEAYARAPKDLRKAEPRPPKQKAPTRFVVDPSGAYEAKECDPNCFLGGVAACGVTCCPLKNVPRRPTSRRKTSGAAGGASGRSPTVGSSSCARPRRRRTAS